MQLPRPLYARVVTEKLDGKSRSHSVQARNGDLVVGHKPPFYADEMGLTSDKYVPLNSTVDHLPLTVTAAAPIEESISTAGGISLDEITEQFELKKLPGNFVIGEMLDWDAPTGGYLLQACFSMGYALAGYLNKKEP